MWSDTLLVVVAFAICVALCAGAFVLLGLGAWVWAKAIRSLYEAGDAKMQVESTRATLADVTNAVDEIRERAPYVPPTDDDLLEAVRAVRNGVPPRDETRTTDENEGIEMVPPIREGGLFR